MTALGYKFAFVPASAQGLPLERKVTQDDEAVGQGVCMHTCLWGWGCVSVCVRSRKGH